MFFVRISSLRKYVERVFLLIGFANVHAAFVVCRTALIPSEVARDRAGVSRLIVPKKNDQGRICNQTQIVNTDKDVAIRTPEAATRLARLYMLAKI